MDAINQRLNELYTKKEEIQNEISSLELQLKQSNKYNNFCYSYILLW